MTDDYEKCLRQVEEAAWRIVDKMNRDDAGDDARIAAASRREWAERAWRAEAERDRLREALRQCPPTSNPTVSEEEHLRRINAWWSLTARAALKGET